MTSLGGGNESASGTETGAPLDCFGPPLADICPAPSDRPAGFASGPGRSGRGAEWRPSRVPGRTGADRGRWAVVGVRLPDPAGRAGPSARAIRRRSARGTFRPTGCGGGAVPSSVTGCGTG